MARVARKVHDRRLLKLIGRYLRAGVMVERELQPSIEGTMPGGPHSPISANILLDDFDKELEQRGLHFVGYADDFLVFSRSGEAAVRVARSIEPYWTRKLKLVINHQKSRVCRTEGVEFLGFAFEGRGGQIRVSPKNERKFRDHVKEITRRNRGVSMRHRMSCYWKQWRGLRTRISNLRKLGVKEDEAVTHGCRRKGPWTMSSSRAVHEALSLDYLAHEGLASLLTIWQKLTAKDLNHPVRTRTPGGMGGAQPRG